MRYGLRTLFVTVTILCCPLAYLAYGISWARERQHFMDANKSVFFESARRSHPSRCNFPALWLVGEPHLATIYVSVPTIQIQPDGSEVEVLDKSPTVPTIKRLFPEADVISFPYRVRSSPDSAL